MEQTTPFDVYRPEAGKATGIHPGTRILAAEPSAKSSKELSVSYIFSEPGATVPPRMSPTHPSLLFIRQGRFEFRVGNRAAAATTGSLILIPGKTSFAFKNSEQSTGSLVYIAYSASGTPTGFSKNNGILMSSGEGDGFSPPGLGNLILQHSTPKGLTLFLRHTSLGGPTPFHRYPNQVCAILAVDGNVVVSFVNGIETLKPGAVLVIPRGIAHSVGSLDKTNSTTLSVLLPGSRLKQFLEETSRLQDHGLSIRDFTQWAKLKGPQFGIEFLFNADGGFRAPNRARLAAARGRLSDPGSQNPL